jgi:hypothetical protein
MAGRSVFGSMAVMSHSSPSADRLFQGETLVELVQPPQGWNPRSRDANDAERDDSAEDH